MNINRSLIFKFLGILSIFGLGLITPADLKDFQRIKFRNFDMVSDAIDGIQQTLSDEREKPYFIKRIYNISGNQVKVKTKAYFAEYRKKPLFKEETLFANLGHQNDLDACVEFIYKKSNKDYITQINKRARLPENNQKIAFRSESCKPETIIKT